MRTDQNNPEDYPRLTPPELVYEGKAALRKPVIVPMFATIISAAAAVALLVTLFWRPSHHRELEMMAVLKPIEAQRIELELPLRMSGQRAHFHITPAVAGKRASSREKTVAPSRSDVPAREYLTQLATLPPCVATAIPSSSASSANLLFGAQPLALNDSFLDDNLDELSWARKEFQKMTDGRFDSFGELLEYGWRSVKGELAQFNESVSNGISSIKDYNSANY